MSYTNGNEYIIKSMNGIKTFDDGTGTVIENGSISANNMATSQINCGILTRPSMITDSIGSTTNLVSVQQPQRSMICGINKSSDRKFNKSGINCVCQYCNNEFKICK